MKDKKQRKPEKAKREFKMVAVDAKTKEMLDTLCEKYNTKQYAIVGEALLLVLPKYPI